MMKAECQIEIDCPIDDVYKFTNGHVSEWSKTVVADELVEEKPEGVGTTFRVTTEDHGRRMDFDGVVTRHEPPTASAIVLTGKHFDIKVEYDFEDLGGRTQVTHRSEVSGKGMTKVMFVLFGWLMKKSSCKAQESELECLKQFCEAQGKTS